MRIAGWMVLLSILAATSVTTAVDFDREISLGQSTGLELAYGAESPVVRVAQRQANFGLMGAIFDSVRDWQNATAPTGWYDAVVAKIMLQVPVAACFAPGTRPEDMAGFEQYLRDGPDGSRYNLQVRWSGSQGSPRNLTWSFVPDGTSISNGIGEGVADSELFARMNTLFNENENLWIGLFEQSFARWGEITGLSYTRVTAGGQPWDDGANWGSVGAPGLRGDLRISMKSLGGQGGVLAYNYFPSNGDMVLDRWDNWSAASNNFRFMRNIIMHEHGHGLGERHVCSSNSQQMMEPFISTQFDGPQHDDIRGGQRYYGDPLEPDNNAASATNLGTVTAEVPLTSPPLPLPNNGDDNPADTALMSIDNPSEQDWFKFRVPGDVAILEVSVTPRGFTYDSSTQNQNGSCNSGNPVNSLARANLDIELYDEDGSTLLASSSTSVSGQTETLSDVEVAGSQDYYVKIFALGSVSGAQFYDLNLSITLPGACCLADGSCELTRATPCALAPGFYNGDGSPCPPDPACTPVDTIMTCELKSSTANPGGTALLELFVEEAVELGAFQSTIVVTKTSGEGTVTVSCPGGAKINERICISTGTFLPTGDTCDGGDTCPVAVPPNACVGRPDYAFSNLATLTAIDCNNKIVAAALQLGSVTVTGERKYIGEFELEVSPDAEAGSTFEIAFVEGSDISFLGHESAAKMPTRYGAPCVLTVSDSSNFLKNRYLTFKPDEPGDVAYQLDMVSSLAHPTAVVSGWVGVPDANGIASLVPDPVTRTWIEPVVNITGCEITPVAEFELRASLDDGQSFLSPIALRTIEQPSAGKFWGDACGIFENGEWTAPQGITNIDDAVCVIKRFQEEDGAPEVARTDMEPQEPNRLVNINDVLFILFAFQADPYPFGCPDDPCQDNLANPCP